MSMDRDMSQDLLEQVNQALNLGTTLRIQGGNSKAMLGRPVAEPRGVEHDEGGIGRRAGRDSSQVGEQVAAGYPRGCRSRDLDRAIEDLEALGLLGPDEAA